MPDYQKGKIYKIVIFKVSTILLWHSDISQRLG